MCICQYDARRPCKMTLPRVYSHWLWLVSFGKEHDMSRVITTIFLNVPRVESLIIVTRVKSFIRVKLLLKEPKCSWHPEKLLQADRFNIIRRATHDAIKPSKQFGVLYRPFLSSRSPPENKWKLRSSVRSPEFHSFVHRFQGTSKTPRKRLIRFPRRAMTGTTLPVCLFGRVGFTVTIGVFRR